MTDVEESVIVSSSSTEADDLTVLVPLEPHRTLHVLVKIDPKGASDVGLLMSTRHRLANGDHFNVGNQPIESVSTPGTGARLAEVPLPENVDRVRVKAAVGTISGSIWVTRG